MTMKEIEEKFRQDTLWLMTDLKQEELANAYSEYQIRYFMRRAEDGPTIESQRRIFKMLADRKALSLRPSFHRMAILDSALQMQEADPIGYYIQIKQPHFDEIFDETSTQTRSPAPTNKLRDQKPEPASDTDDRYFITLNKKRQVMLNDTFVLSTPNFAGENESFIEYVIAHPDEKLTKAAMESELKKKLKKSFHSILSDLGFKGEIRKLFFDASKNAVQFKNPVLGKELSELGIDKEKLAAELSVLGGSSKKGDEEEADTGK